MPSPTELARRFKSLLIIWTQDEQRSHGSFLLSWRQRFVDSSQALCLWAVSSTLYDWDSRSSDLELILQSRQTLNL
ncbi:mCG1027193 [Mus musculus]|nr:mCG1027193 [Mus musculus]